MTSHLLRRALNLRPTIVNRCGQFQGMFNITTSNTRMIHVSKSNFVEEKLKQNVKRVKESDTSLQKRVKENVKSVKEKRYDKDISNPDRVQHFKRKVNQVPPTAEKWREITRKPGEEAIGSSPDEPYVNEENPLPHPIWSKEDVLGVKITHTVPNGIIDRLSWLTIRLLRAGFDKISGFDKEPRTEAIWLNRIIFLETVAGVPGMVGAMIRHLHSLRTMTRDHGWIHTLLEEAENERMHLMTAMCLKNPGLQFRAGIIGAQTVFVGFFSIAYIISPKYCHRMVGYLEEEAVVTYTKLLEEMDGGTMKEWNDLLAPPLAIHYWKLKPTATMKDVVLSIRADEAHHMVVNHTLASLKKDDYNPYKPGE